MLDAARRAAGVDDHRLIRVLDVGREESLAYVVTELVSGSTMRDLLRDGPLPAEDVRTLVGEVSVALENARHRGLHHLALTPGDVHQLDDDSVKLGGLAVQAALDGEDGDNEDADEATARDTEALVALAYAGLTGYWPLATAAGLPAAPRVSGAPATPSEIVGGVPADLDTLCAQAFAGAGPPSSPGDLAAQIAPWGRDRRPVRATGAFPLPLPPPRPARPDTGAGRERDETAVLPIPPGPPQPATPAPSARTSSGSSATTVSTTQATAAGSVTGGADQSPAPDPRPARRWLPRRTPPGPATDVTIGTAFGPGVFEDRPESPAPLLPPAPVDRPPGTQTRTVLLLVTGFVTVFFLLAYCGLRGLGDNAHVARPGRTAAPSSTSPATPPSTSSPPAPTSPPPAPPARVTVASVTGFDPQGDGSEKDSIAGRAVDGDPSTSWISETYRSTTFGGLKKGVGLLLDLGATTKVSSVVVSVGGSGAQLQLRTATGDTLKGSTVVAQAAEASGAVTLTPKGPVTSRYLVLWFTTPARSGGGYRAVVDEVAIS